MTVIRKPVFAANWKMYKGPREAAEFVAQFSELYGPKEDRRVVFFPPAISVPAFRAAAVDRPDLEVGVQDVHPANEGAHTGAMSAGMAAQAGATWALAGHSERRREFGDADAVVGRKVVRILDAGLQPLLCVGETLEERERGDLEAVLSRQLGGVLPAVGAKRGGSLVFAYEPVWAIGTGLTASPADAAEAHAFLRAEIDRHSEAGSGAGSVILYGGSVRPGNIQDLMAAPGVDGVLVGGASLDPQAFAAICDSGGG